MDLQRYFDRVVVINLKRRPDRLLKVKQALRGCSWPFRQPEVFAAVDGKKARPPKFWTHGAGAWGCTRSHLAVLEQAMKDGVDRILILEDDICFTDNFRRKVGKFLRQVPDDWDGLMLGGQHIVKKLGWPPMIRPGVYRCLDCERTHCYAVRGEYMRRLCERWQGGGRFRGNAHCDRIMAQDPSLQSAHKVYAPEYFLVGQDRCASDVSGTVFPRKFWNPPGPELPLINLHAPRAVAEELRQYGLHMGYPLDGKSGIDRNLARAFTEIRRSRSKGNRLLRDWIITAQWEVASDSGFIATIWHPHATPKLMQAVSLWPVCEIMANSLGDALQQLPRRMKKIDTQ